MQVTTIISRCTVYYKIPLFDGSNFGNWKFRIETLLTELELLELTEMSYVDRVQFLSEGTAAEKTKKEKELEVWAKKDKKCRNQIVQRIADSHLEYAKDRETAFDIWKSLTGTFERKGIASHLLIRKNYSQ